MSDISTLRRALTTAGLAAGVALSVVGCSSSSNGNPLSAASSGVTNAAPTSGSVPAAVSSAPVTSASAPSLGSGNGSSSAPTGGGSGDNRAICTDLGTLITQSSKIAQVATGSGGASAHFSELKLLYGQLADLGTKIGAEAPAGIASDAKTFASSINALNDVVKDASSVSDVQAKVTADPKLKAASSSFQGTVTNLVKWRSANCT